VNEKEQEITMDNSTTKNVSEILLTIKDVEAHLQLGHTKVTELVISGKLPSLKIGKSRRVRRIDLDKFLESLIDQNNE
jgi:excisionase family DNA binding protein